MKLKTKKNTINNSNYWANMEDVFVQWKNYHEQFRFSIMEMRRTGDFCDVTLMCEDGEVQAHQMVLITGSEVFSRMLKGRKRDQKVQLKGITKDELRLILDYIYNGQAVISKNEIDSFFKKGNLLGLLGFQGEFEKQKGLNMKESKTSDELETDSNETIDHEFERIAIQTVEEQNIIQTNETISTDTFKHRRDYYNPEKNMLHKFTNDIEDSGKGNNVIFKTTKKSGTNNIEIETIKFMANKEKSHQTSKGHNIKEKPIFEDCLDRLGTNFVSVGEKHEYQDGSLLTVLDVLIRNSITRGKKGNPILNGQYLCNFCKEEFTDIALL